MLTVVEYQYLHVATANDRYLSSSYHVKLCLFVVFIMVCEQLKVINHYLKFLIHATMKLKIQNT